MNTKTETEPGWAACAEESVSLPTNHSDSSGHLLLMRLKEDRKRPLSSCKRLLLDTPWVAKGLSDGRKQESAVPL